MSCNTVVTSGWRPTPWDHLIAADINPPLTICAGQAPVSQRSFTTQIADFGLELSRSFGKTRPMIHLLLKHQPRDPVERRAMMMVTVDRAESDTLPSRHKIGLATCPLRGTGGKRGVLATTARKRSQHYPRVASTQHNYGRWQHRRGSRVSRRIISGYEAALTAASYTYLAAGRCCRGHFVPKAGNSAPLGGCRVADGAVCDGSQSLFCGTATHLRGPGGVTHHHESPVHGSARLCHLSEGLDPAQPGHYRWCDE